MYNVMKKIILSGNYNKTDTINKLDIFLAKDKITINEYDELNKLIEPANINNKKGGTKDGLTQTI